MGFEARAADEHAFRGLEARAARVATRRSHL